MKHISHVLFDAILLILENVPRDQQKSILTDNYERGVITGDELSYSIKKLALESA